MKFGYTTIYVKNIAESLAFFEKAFGFKTRFTYEDCYGELETGETTIAFATHESGKTNFPTEYRPADGSDKPLGMMVAFVTDTVAKCHERAINSGATSIQDPIEKPWGQTVSYLRCPDGTLVELCSPVAG